MEKGKIFLLISNLSKVFFYLGHIFAFNAVVLTAKGVFSGLRHKGDFYGGFFSAYASDVLSGGEILPDGRIIFQIPDPHHRYFNFLIIILAPALAYLVCLLLRKLAEKKGF